MAGGLEAGKEREQEGVPCTAHSLQDPLLTVQAAKEDMDWNLPGMCPDTQTTPPAGWAVKELRRQAKWGRLQTCQSTTAPFIEELPGLLSLALGIVSYLLEPRLATPGFQDQILLNYIHLSISSRPSTSCFFSALIA